MLPRVFLKNLYTAAELCDIIKKHDDGGSRAEPAALHIKCWEVIP